MIPLPEPASHVVACLTTPQLWSGLTSYVNRHGSWTWRERVLTAVNMMATACMTSVISAGWVDGIGIKRAFRR